MGQLLSGTGPQGAEEFDIANGETGPTGSQGPNAPESHDDSPVKPEDGPDTKYQPAPQFTGISPVHNTGSHGCPSFVEGESS